MNVMHFRPAHDKKWSAGVKKKGGTLDPDTKYTIQMHYIVRSFFNETFFSCVRTGQKQVKTVW